MNTDILITASSKSFPPKLWGSKVDEIASSMLRLSDFQTPIVTLDRSALDHNVRIMFDWIRNQGVELAPHGKTTMAPILWQELLDAGAWGLTLATAWQAQVGVASGLKRILIANTVTDPTSLAWLSDALEADPALEITTWVDSIETVDAMEAHLPKLRRRIPVLVELGAAGARTGARTVEQAIEIAKRIHGSSVLELAGVAGYEGALAHGRSKEVLSKIDSYLDAIGTLYEEVAALGLIRESARPIITAGGSEYFDRVADRLGHFAKVGVDVVLRSGAFQIHDDVLYFHNSPMGREIGTEPFHSAMHAWLRVVSHPEPGLVLLDGGKRDLAFDEGMPVPQAVVGVSVKDSELILRGAEVTKLNDQHAFLRLASAETGALPPGTVVRFGLSHPCTVMDKWRVLPVIDSVDAQDPAVIGAVATCF